MPKCEEDLGVEVFRAAVIHNAHRALAQKYAGDQR